MWASVDGGVSWEFGGRPGPHDPTTLRNHQAVGRTADGALVVLTTGWSNEYPEGETGSPFLASVIPPWVSRPTDQGRTLEIDRSEDSIAATTGTLHPGIYWNCRTAGCCSLMATERSIRALSRRLSCRSGDLGRRGFLSRRNRVRIAVSPSGERRNLSAGPWKANGVGEPLSMVIRWSGRPAIAPPCWRNRSDWHVITHAPPHRVGLAFIREPESFHAGNGVKVCVAMHEDEVRRDRDTSDESIGQGQATCRGVPQSDRSKGRFGVNG